jgi:phenazine biosynthesis protein phzE
VLGVCLGHQILAQALGLRVARLPTPDQGRQTGIELFGTGRRVGFYNSYVAYAPARDSAQAPANLQFSLAPGDPDPNPDQDQERRVHAVRTPTATGLQFHPESVLTTEGLQILDAELSRLAGGERTVPDEVLLNSR